LTKWGSCYETAFFIAEEPPEGGYTAHALGASIFTQADSFADLREKIRDAVNYHYEESQEPKIIRPH